MASLYPKRSFKEKYILPYSSFIIAIVLAVLILLILFHVGTTSANYETQIIRSCCL